jgi:hypothetical protein
MGIPELAEVAQGAQSPGVAFNDAGTLKLKVDPKLKPDPLESLRTTVKVCNVSDVKARPPAANMSRFEKGTDAPRELLNASSTGDKTEWEAGDCRDVVLAPSAKVTLDSGTYTGVLTVVSSVGLARRTVTIDGPDDVAKPVAGKGASDTTKLKATRWWPGDSARLADGGRLLLKPAATNEKLSVPSECPEPDASPKPKGDATSTATSTPAPANNSSKADADPCSFVGNVINGTDVAKVSVAGRLNTPADQPAELPLALESADHAGTYAGSLDLASTPGDPDDDVKLSVVVKDAWWCAAFALLLGAALSFGSQWRLRRSLPKRRFRDRYKKFSEKYRLAVIEFNEHRPEGDEPASEAWTPPSLTDINDIAKAIEAGIGRYKASTVYWDTTSEAYKELDRSLALVEDDIDCLKDPTRLRATLTSLADALKALATFLDTRYHPPRAPRFVVPAAAHLKGPVPKPESTPEAEAKPAVAQPAAAKTPRLAVGQALTITAAAKAATELIAAWTKLAERVLEYDPWWDRLAEKAWEAEQNGPSWPKAHVTRLIDAASSLAEAKEELLTVVDAAELGEFETTGDLKRAYTSLAYLSGLYGGWPGERVARRTTRMDAIVAFGLTDTMFEDQSKAAELRADAAQRPRHQLRDWLSEAEPVDARGAKAAKLDKLDGLSIAILPLAFTFAAAVATGLAAFYFGKDTWGTWEDYVTVIVVGAAATALVQSVVDAVSRVLPTAPKQLITGPAAAILKPPAAPVAPVAAKADSP